MQKTQAEEFFDKLTELFGCYENDKGQIIIGRQGDSILFLSKQEMIDKVNEAMGVI